LDLLPSYQEEGLGEVLFSLSPNPSPVGRGEHVIGNELKIICTIFNSTHYSIFEDNLSVLTAKNGEGIG